jgi:light-regulated signal transduction histidine kinase (bacteriophytochrome)
LILNRKAIFISISIALALASVFIFVVIYRQAERAAIAKPDQQQMIYARQAARGIEDYFATWTGNLSALSQMNTVVADDSEGRAVLKLSICRTIINAHGGKLWAENDSARGATFHLLLPASPARNS